MASEETGDATRRTLLASERTTLAWLRTGLTVLAVAVGIGKIAPGIDADQNATAWEVLGALYAVLGVAVVSYGLYRGRRVDQAVREGRFVSLDDMALWAIGGATVVLGIATAVLIVVGV